MWTGAGQVAKLREFNSWLGTVPCANKVVIMGNHESIGPSLGRARLAALLTNAKYLENEVLDVCGFRVFATPLSKGRSGNAAYQDEAFAATAKAAAKATAPVDILITHGPSQGKVSSRSTATELEPWARHLKPRLHLWDMPP